MDIPFRVYDPRKNNKYHFVYFNNTSNIILPKGLHVISCSISDQHLI